MEFFFSIIAAIFAGIILLILEYRTGWFSRKEQKQDKTVPDWFNLFYKYAPRRFIDEIILERKDPSITSDNLDQERAQLLSEINDMLLKQLIISLSDDGVVILEALLDRNANDEEIKEFLIEQIPDIELEITNALLDFRTEYLLRRTFSENRTTST